ncbi:C40 family peptidase [Georgenia thermotolerans]|uniref:C40 family peptidase n=1 Tax=Georgenia thermotolerans TaxID=527326 RepID=UPI001D00371E|nr:C40 family peptidase [Georgenia thermotolerans]
MSGVAAVQARIGAIEARIAQVTGSVAMARDVNLSSAAGATATSATSPAVQGINSDATFAAALNSAMAATTASSGTGLSTSQLLGSFTGAPAGTGAGFVAAASKYLGVPYVWGGESASGMDCSGLVQRAFADIGVSVPRTAREQMRIGTEVGSLAQAQPGDLIVTRGGGHIAIYLGDNKILHAPRPGEKVSVRELFETDKDINTIRRVLPSGTGVAAAGGISAATGANAATAALASLAVPGLGSSGTPALDPARLALQLSTGGLR